jgi:hypothetical protein
MIQALHGSKSLIQLTLILLAFTGVRGMMTRARKMSCKCFARATSLGGGPDHILPLLGPLLTVRVCHTRFLKTKTRCSSYVCPGSSYHTYGQKCKHIIPISLLYRILLQKFISSPERTKQRNGPHLVTGS